MDNIIAVVVARSGSVRIEKKMFRHVGGYNIVERKVRQLLRVKQLDKIVVGTDVPEMSYLQDICNDRVLHILRPPQVCDEKVATANDMIRDMLGRFESKHVLWSHPTNPICSEKEYSEAIDMYFQGLEQHDSVFGASKLCSHFWFRQNATIKPHIVPLNFIQNPKQHIVASKLEPVFSQNGSIFIRNHTDMLFDGNFLGHTPKMFVMDDVSGWDVNEEWELKVANVLASSTDSNNPL